MSLDDRRRAKSNRNLGGEDPKPPLLGSQSSRRRRSDGGAIVGHRVANKNTLEIYRGVRPRLDHIQCPVTKKTLMDDVLTVQGDDGYIDASMASTSNSTSTTSHDHIYDDDDNVDTYSDSDIGLNHSASRDEASRRQHRSSRNRNINAHRNSNNLDGRKGERLERELERDSHTCNTSQQRQRRLPKHYTNIPEAAADRGRNTMHTNQSRHSLSKMKGSEKKQNNNNNTSHQKRTSASPSSKISTEIAQFQKMVADLESLSRSSASSPEAMWKSRILLRSARDANRDLKLALEKEERAGAGEGGIKSVGAAARAASKKKLKRDYHRASEQFRSIVEETERRQRAEISCLTASEAAAAGVNPEGGAAASAQKRAVIGAAEAEEDFFDRAMRERQAEVQKISDGMKKVQEIYTDLAGLVDGQQDQIDQLEDINDEVKTDTRAGLEEIQHGIWKLCVADQHKKGGIGPENSFDRATNRNMKKKVIDPSDFLNCMMVCQGPDGLQSGSDGLSLKDDLYHERTTTDANYYRDGKGSESAWNLPNLEQVQESAQDAYERGHAMVGGLVGQVHGVVASGDGLPLQLREVGNRISCTPQPEEYSRSKPRCKHHNRHHQNEPEQWEEDACRQHDEAPSKKERQRRKGRRHGEQRNNSSR
jgi:t-SNARE complex subunit (syntaxin)